MRIPAKDRQGGWGWRRPTLVLGWLALTGTALFWGRHGILPQATAQQPAAKANQSQAKGPVAPGAPTDYSRRVVAYINGNVPITREDLGEYLIAREGAEKLELLVNKRIIEMYCKERNVEVTAAEVDAALGEDLKGMQIDLNGFVEKVLKHYNKTLYEWKEDVIRPKLLMTKLCKDRVHVTDQDLKDAFEAYYGEKMDCRIILFPKGETRPAMEVYAKVRDSEEEFDRYSRQQASPQLAATRGQIRPIARHTTGNDLLEKEAFSLKPGEVSSVIDTPEGPVILKCVGHLPPDKTKKLESERAALEKEVVEKKIQQEIPVLFKEMRDKAQPVLFLKNYTREEDLYREVHETLSSGSPGSPVKAPPHGN